MRTIRAYIDGTWRLGIELAVGRKWISFVLIESKPRIRKRRIDEVESRESFVYKKGEGDVEAIRQSILRLARGQRGSAIQKAFKSHSL